MKDKILIIGNQGTGKTRLATELSAKLGYTLVDGVGSIEELKKKATPNTIYVTNAVDERTALSHLVDNFDFTIIKLIIF